MLGGVVPIDVLQLPRELGCRLQKLGALDKASLYAQLYVLLHNAFHGLYHQRGAQFHEFVVQVPGRIRGLYPALGTQDNAAGINFLVNHEGGDTGNVLAVNHRPVDGRSAAVLRQQGCVQVEGAQLGHGPHHLRQHAEAHYHKEVRLPGGKLLQEGLVLEFFRL